VFAFRSPAQALAARFAASRSRLQNYRGIVSFAQPKIWWNAFKTGFHWESAFVREIPNPTLHWESSFVREITNPTLRWGWVFLERTRILSRIQFTTHFIEIFVVETKRFVSSFVNVILSRQTCGQRSSRAAESKHRALGNYFLERICYMFLISKCRGDSDLGLCTTSGLAFEETQRSGDFGEKYMFGRLKNRILLLHIGSRNASTEVVQRLRSESPLHFDIRNM